MNSAVLALALLAPAAPPPPAAPDVKQTVRTGLKWLADQQKMDGSWPSLNDFAPTTTTVTAALALLMEGSTLKDGAYAPHLRKFLVWLEKHTNDQGRLASNTQNEQFQYVPLHSNALVVLACMYDTDDDPARRERLEKMLVKATKYLLDQQGPRGGFGFVGAKDPNGGGYDDSQSTATALQALLAVRKVGIEVPTAATDKALRYLAKATNRDGGVIYSTFGGAVPMGNDGQPGISATAAAGALTGDGARPEQLAAWVRNTRSTNPAPQPQFLRNGGTYILIQQYQACRVAFALGETGHRRLDPTARDEDLFRWSVHRAKVYKALKESQGKNGSWPDDQAIGPVYATALALVILQLDNDYLPALSR